MNSAPHLRFRSAFTLIETLVVVSIIVLILALTGPSILGTLQGSKLSSAGDTIVGILSEAQQMAQAQNAPVEVRFFKYTTPMNTTESYRSVMLLRVTTPTSASGEISEEFVPIGDVQRIPDGVVIVNDEETLSPLLEGEGFRDIKSNDSDLGYAGVTDATYNAIRFMTDGSCRKVSQTSGGVASLGYPPLNQSCITLCGDTGQQEITEQNLPQNFYCIQIDPYTGKIRTYRPGQN